MMKSLVILFALALGSASAQTTPPPAGKAIVQEKCVMCHALSVVTSKRASPKEWDQVVNQMVSRGADLSDDEIDTVIAYLAKNYGPIENINKATADELVSSLGLAKAEAEAIVKYREQKGNFKTWHDVAAVPGVSADEIEGLQQRLTFE